MCCGEAEPIVRADIEDSAHGLLLEPFARVARIGLGAFCKFIGRCRSIGGEAAVVAQAVAEVDAGQVECADHGGEETF